MQPKQQLEFLIAGKMALAVSDYLNSNSSAVQTRRVLSRDLFDAWADTVELPYGRVFRKKGGEDGVYVLQDAEGWLVVEQANGISMPGKRVYGTYKQAKKAALACELQDVLRSPGR